jgi:hypothetical protein
MLALLMLLTPPAAPPIKAFILSGQSNMVGHGFFAANPERNGGKGSLEQVAKSPNASKKLKRLLDKTGAWRTRDDVWIDYFDRKGKLTVGYGAGPDCIGPELGFGFAVGDAIREPVLLIKVAWGGKSLAEDFRPPSSGGTVGPNYKEVVRLSKEAIADVGTRFPEQKGRKVQIAGFGWHQGWNDRVNTNFVKQYEVNMANFIRDIRKDLGVPKMPFVVSETGMGGLQETDQDALALMNAQAAVAKYPEFKGNVAFVGTRAFWRPKEISPSAQDYHWNSNGETYFLIGDAMGNAMNDLLKRAKR